MSVSEAVSATCPTAWQPPMPRLRRPRRIPWPLAFLAAPLLWVMPRRMGPCLATVRWPGVIAAHLLWTTWGLGWITLVDEPPDRGFYGYLFGAGPPPVDAWSCVSELLRAPLVVLLEELVNSIGSAEKWLVVLGAGLLWEAGLALLGLLMLPFAAAGERPWKLAGRCIKLSLWSTTMLAPTAILLAVVLSPGPGDSSQPMAFQAFQDTRPEEWLAPAIAVFWLWVFLRSLLDGVAPVDERLVAPRPVLCEDCGYHVGGLDPTGRCPECGRAVGESLPGHRGPTPLAAASRLARPVGFLRTWWQAMFRRGFYDHLAVHGEYEAAREFAFNIFGLAAALLITFLGVHAMVPARREGAEWLAAVLPGLAVSLWPVPLIGARLLFDIRDPGRLRRHATVVFYALAWHLPMLALMVLVLVALERIEGWDLLRGADLQIPGGPRIRRFDLAAILAGLLPLALFVIAAIRVRAGIRQTRFANG